MKNRHPILKLLGATDSILPFATTYAGMGVVTRFISMGSLSVFGFIKGFQPIAGYSYGSIVWGLNGIMYAQPIADVLSAVITVFMAIPLHKKLNNMHKQAAAINTNDNN